MEIKSIEVILQEIAEESKYATWELFLRCERYKPSLVNGKWKQACLRYAQQFQEQAPTDVLTTEIMVLRERNEELVEMLEGMVFDFENTSKSSSDILMASLGKAKQLINKNKEL